jgi:hypothetical protein
MKGIGTAKQPLGPDLTFDRMALHLLPEKMHLPKDENIVQDLLRSQTRFLIIFLVAATIMIIRPNLQKVTRGNLRHT